LADGLTKNNKGNNMARNRYGKIKNPALKEQWLKDLESGNFRQCQRTLCEQGGRKRKVSYCCLGVLGRSIQRAKVLPVVFSDNGFKERELVFKDKSSDDSLPDNLKKEVGLTERGMQHLIEMNDLHGKNFKEIADWVRTHL
jgi:hypothetical protein